MIRVLKFGAKWCSQCSMLEIPLKHFGRPIENYDVDVDKELSNSYNILGLPSIIVLKDDVEVGRVVGYTPNVIERVVDIIEKHEY